MTNHLRRGNLNPLVPWKWCLDLNLEVMVFLFKCNTELAGPKCAPS